MISRVEENIESARDFEVVVRVSIAYVLCLAACLESLDGEFADRFKQEESSVLGLTKETLVDQRLQRI
jgi:hypothetical protein